MSKKSGIPSAILLLLGACGGSGSGGVNTPPPPPPAPTNTTITDLKASQNFVSDAAGMKVSFDTVTDTGISGEIRPNSLTISYNADTKTYSVNADGRSQNFTPADIKSNADGETIYEKPDGAHEYLTIVTTPYSSSTSNKYVGLAYWQRNVLTDTRQDTDFYVLTYGLPTAAAGVPRTGTAGFRTDTFGAVSFPGEEPRSFNGQGEFSVDFAAGVFSTHSYLTETTLVTGGSEFGGGMEFIGAGHLSSSDGSFSGNALYRGRFGGAAGTLSGRFYGPAGEELGGAFSGSNTAGMTVVGGFTGQRDANVIPENLTLTNLTKSQLFYTRFQHNLVGQLNRQNSETFSYSTPTSDLYGGHFTINDKVASSDPNFVTYRKSFSSSYDTQDVELRLYKPGPDNSELALTYASFVHYSTSVPFAGGRTAIEQYAAYGLETPPGLLAGKTGTGSYSGVLYATGQQYPSTTSYAVKGTSQLTVDFGAQSYTGVLGMAGTASDGSGTVEFGNYDVAGTLGMVGASGTVSRNGTPTGEFTPFFYGPDGEEIVAPFSTTAPTGAPGAGITIAGVAAAKRE